MADKIVYKTGGHIKRTTATTHGGTMIPHNIQHVIEPEIIIYSLLSLAKPKLNFEFKGDLRAQRVAPS